MQRQLSPAADMPSHTLLGAVPAQNPKWWRNSRISLAFRVLSSDRRIIDDHPPSRSLASAIWRRARERLATAELHHYRGHDLRPRPVETAGLEFRLDRARAIGAVGKYVRRRVALVQERQRLAVMDRRIGHLVYKAEQSHFSGCICVLMSVLECPKPAKTPIGSEDLASKGVRVYR